MKSYIADLIPKIKRYSKQLDDVILITNQHWVLINEEEGLKISYIFRANGDLLVSTNGKVEKSSWEYLGNDSLLISLKEEIYLFKNGFLDENILALKVDGKDEYVFLINEKKYNDNVFSIVNIIEFLKTQYISNPLSKFNKGLLSESFPKYSYKIIEEITEWTIAYGNRIKYKILLNDKDLVYVYKKQSLDEYFAYINGEVKAFKSIEECINTIYLNSINSK